jgi:hypothetical protein
VNVYIIQEENSWFEATAADRYIIPSDHARRILGGASFLLASSNAL